MTSAISVALFVLFCAFSVQGTVLKKGIESSFPVEMLDTPFGRIFMENYDQRIIFPGTKWCGNGDNAEDENDLGRFEQTDKCCRTHDFCDDILLAGESNHGLVNDGPFTKLHCKCDQAFFKCLEQSSDLASSPVAITYFNVVGAQCYDLKPPAECVQWDDILGFRKRCVKYSYDVSQPLKWQWFDLPRWILGPNDTRRQKLILN